MSDLYILDKEHNAIPCGDVQVWGKWFEEASLSRERVVRSDTVGDCDVSTVFLGIDHGFGQSPPQLFETMIFGGTRDGEIWRCGTWDEAVKQHQAAIDSLTQEKP